MNKSISTIETLSNELFLNIFEYICTYNLFNTFYRLNFRFYSLINSFKHLYLTLEEDWDNQQPIMPFFSVHITTLIIKHDEFIDFSFFPNLRSLKLDMPTSQQCNAIQPHILVNLEQLYISNLYFSDHTAQLCRFIFSSSFPYLQSCQINSMTFTNFYFYSSLSRQQLTSSPCTWNTNMFNQIFNACPDFTFLRIAQLQNISFELIPHSIPSHTSIRRLFIHFYSMEKNWSNQMDCILSLAPNLKTFALKIDEKEGNIEFPFISFSRMLIQRVPHLIHFKAKIPLNQLLSTKLDVVQYLHPLFLYIKLQKQMHEDDNPYLIISSGK